MSPFSCYLSFSWYCLWCWDIFRNLLCSY